jgi:hypothetical protein
MATEWCVWSGLPAHDRQTDIVNAAVKQELEEEGGEDESKTCTAVRSSLNISQNKQPLQTVSQNKCHLC